MDIAAWLRNLGLERYETAFRDNDINAAVLPKLTAEDLKEIGVASVGHRRTLLEAIAALRKTVPQRSQTASDNRPVSDFSGPDAVSASGAAPSVSTPGSQTASTAAEAERRQL